MTKEGKSNERSKENDNSMESMVSSYLLIDDELFKSVNDAYNEAIKQKVEEEKLFTIE